jgi:hypothetical protein
MRIIARLDPAVGEQMRWLVATSGRTASHIVREAITAEYQRLRAGAAPGPQRLLARLAQGGAALGGSGRSDIASNAKSALGEALDHKLGLAPVKAPKAAPRRRG